MPLFEFTCSSCDHEFEELVRNTRAAAEMTCPKCSSKKVSRKFSVFAARSESPAPAPMPGGGGCGRCGDPNGPCSM